MDRQKDRNLKHFGPWRTTVPDIQCQADKDILAYVQVPTCHPQCGLAVSEIEVCLISVEKELQEDGVITKHPGDESYTITASILGG